MKNIYGKEITPDPNGLYLNPMSLAALGDVISELQRIMDEYRGVDTRLNHYFITRISLLKSELESLKDMSTEVWH
jgi:hypothetical protein